MTTNVDEWREFLTDYSRGKERLPPLVDKSCSTAPPPPLPTFDVPLYPEGEISASTAQLIADFYAQYNFLPPPRADQEPKRRALISEYNLFRADQTDNFERTTSLVSSIFPWAPICTISLFQNDSQIVVTKRGPFPVQPGEFMVTETSICGHVVLKKRGEPTELCDINSDWKFFGNPWCSRNPGGLQGYIGVPITLAAEDSEQISVGVLALMGTEPFPKLNDTQRDILNNITAMLSVQLRATWEGWRGGKETRMRDAVSSFLETALVEPSRAAVVSARVAMDPPIQGSPRPRPQSPKGAKAKTLSTNALFAGAAEQIFDLLEADFVAFVDLSPFYVMGSHRWTDMDRKEGLFRHVLASRSSAASRELAKNFASQLAMQSVAQFLDLFATTSRSIFPAPWGLSGLEPILGSSSAKLDQRGSSASVPHIALPFYAARQPKLLLIVSSAAPLFTFNPAEVTFARNIGLVLMARLAQDSVVEASAHKTAFVSQMSHELRTPLHGLLGQLDLIRDRLSNGDFGAVPALLDSAEFCGAGLRDIVDDVLDFGKMSHASQAQIHALPNARQGKVDLLPITLEALRSSWIRRLQFLSATSSSPHDGHSTDSRSATDFGLLFEYEDRSGLGDWWLSIDVAGFRRILNNLLINSLKYTAKGMVKISLATKLGLDYEGNPVPQITLRCADTGRGIPPSFLNKLFEPFTQVDSFSPGAGLGLHITKTIVDRMDGTITVDSRPGKGTTFTVTIPIEDLALRPPDTPPTMKQVPISDEQPPRPLLSPGPVPPTPTAGPEALDEPHLTILVVDDNIISRKILVTISKKLNATTHQAADGMDAIEVFRKVQPDVVWTDVSMPRMDGVTAAKEMRAIERERGWKASHIVAITGLGMSDEHIRREALTSSAALDGWLIKGQVNMKTMRESLVALRNKLRTRASTI